MGVFGLYLPKSVTCYFLYLFLLHIKPTPSSGYTSLTWIGAAWTWLGCPARHSCTAVQHTAPGPSWRLRWAYCGMFCTGADGSGGGNRDISPFPKAQNIGCHIARKHQIHMQYAYIVYTDITAYQ